MILSKIVKEAGIECESARVVCVTAYVCRHTTPDAVNKVLKNIGVYEEYRAVWSDEDETAVYINRMYTNGKSWD